MPADDKVTIFIMKVEVQVPKTWTNEQAAVWIAEGGMTIMECTKAFMDGFIKYQDEVSFTVEIK